MTDEKKSAVAVLKAQLQAQINEQWKATPAPLVRKGEKAADEGSAADKKAKIAFDVAQNYRGAIFEAFVSDLGG